MIDGPIQRILIIRLSAIGDVIMASALIPALREAYPEARIAWLTEETNAATQNNAEAAAQLKDLAGRLQASVAYFKV